MLLILMSSTSTTTHNYSSTTSKYVISKSTIHYFIITMHVIISYCVTVVNNLFLLPMIQFVKTTMDGTFQLILSN